LELVYKVNFRLTLLFSGLFQYNNKNRKVYIKLRKNIIKKMVNKQLVDYIKNAESKGYSPQQLHDYLVQRGYNSIEVREAIDFVNKSKTSSLSNKKFISIGIFMIIVVAAVAASFLLFTKPMIIM